MRTFGSPIRRFGQTLGMMMGGGASVPAPSGLAVTGAVAGVVANLTPQLTWTDTGGIDSWIVDYSTSATFATYTRSTPTVPNQTLATQPNSTRLYFRVYAVRGALVSSASATLQCDVLLFVMRDLFTDVDDAPMTSPRTPVPVAGGVTAAITDTGNLLSTNGAGLASSGQSTAASDPMLVYGPFTRKTGRTLRFRAMARSGGSSNSPMFVWSGAAGGAPYYGIQVGSVWWPLPGNGAHDASVLDSLKNFDLVMRTTGYLIFIDNVLFDVIPVGTESPLYATLRATSNARRTFNAAEVHTIDLEHGFESDYSFNTVDVATPSAGVDYEASGDGITILHFTLPGTPGASDSVGIQYHYVNATHYYWAHIDWNSGTSKWDYKLDLVNGGAPSNLVTVADVGATTVGLKMIAEGASHIGSTFTSSVLTARGTDISNSTVSVTEATIRVTSTGVTLGRLESLPRTDTRYGYLNANPADFF